MVYRLAGSWIEEMAIPAHEVPVTEAVVYKAVEALARSPALVTVSRSRGTAHFTSWGVPFQPVILFSRGLSINELSQVYTFLTACAVYPRGRKSAWKTRYFHALGFVV